MTRDGSLGNPAMLVSAPVAFRPCLTAGLAFLVIAFYHIKKAGFNEVFQSAFPLRTWPPAEHLPIDLPPSTSHYCIAAQ